MSFRWTKNLGLASLLAVLLLYALLAQRESRLFDSAIDEISLAHNVRHNEAVKLIQHLNSADVELEIYQKRDITSTDDIVALFKQIELHHNELLDTSRNDISGNLSALDRTVKTLLSAWSEYFHLWKSGENPSDETMQAYFDLLFKHCEIAIRMIDLIHEEHQHNVTPAIDYALWPLKSAFISATQKLAAYNEHIPININDILHPVKSLYQIVINASSNNSAANLPEQLQQTKTTQPRTNYSPELVKSVSHLSDTVDLMFATRSNPTGVLHQQSIRQANTQMKSLELDLQKLFESTKTEIDQTVTAIESRLSFLGNIRRSTTVLGFLLAALISIVLGRALTSYLANVTKGTQRLATGRLDYRINVTHNDELGMLGHSFNQMADKLSARESEREKLINTLDITAKRADSANIAKSEFMASMSHEIRTPINGVLGTTDLLLREPLSRSQKHLVETIHRSGYSLLGIINDILDFSKIEAGSMQLDPAPFNLLMLTEDVAEMGAPAAHDKGLELNCIIQPGTPEFVIGDALRLRQVLTNLVSNAIKFTDSGEVVIDVASHCATERSVSYSISVKDTGIGIAKAAQKDIFTAFSQADRSTTRRYGGTGLGLSITVQLLRLMHGTVTVDSAPGRGSIFTIELTLKRDQEATDEQPAPVFEKPMHALLVSPNGSTRKALHLKLQSLGISSKTFSSGSRAILEIENSTEPGETPYNLMFIDHLLSDMDCLEFLEKLKPISKKTSEINKIALCLAGENTLLDHARNELGLDVRLVKPIRQSALYNTLLEIRGDSADNQAASPSDQIIEKPIIGNVLLVEDHPINQDIITRMLTLIGCDVELACNGQEAVNRLNDGAFDVVFMDCDMPVLDGFEATRIIRKSEADTAGAGRQVIIALTANALQGDRKRCMDAGMDDYMSKPVDLKDLRWKLASWISSAARTGSQTGTDPAIIEQEPAAENSPASDLSQAVINKPEILDLEILNELISMDDDDPKGFLQSLLQDFTLNFKTDHQRLVASINAGDTEQSRKLAHRLKSSSATIGAPRLASACSKIEQLAKAGKLEELHVLAQSLPAEQKLALQAISGLTRKAA